MPHVFSFAPCSRCFLIIAARTEINIVFVEVEASLTNVAVCRTALQKPNKDRPGITRQDLFLSLVPVPFLGIPGPSTLEFLRHRCETAGLDNGGISGVVLDKNRKFTRAGAMGG